MSAALRVSMLKPDPSNDTSVTTANLDLTETVQQVLEETMVLTTQERTEDDAPRDFSAEDFNSQTYEDILATAVLNKVIDRCSDARDNTLETCQEQTGTDTDSGLSGSIRGENVKCNQQNTSQDHSEESLSSPCHSPKEKDRCFQHKMRVSPQSSLCSSDVGVDSDGQQEHIQWEYEAEPDKPVQFQIEEHIEEITTHHLTDENLDNEESDENDQILSSEPCVPLHTDSCPTSLEDCSRVPKKTIRKKQRTSRTAEAVDEVLPSLHVLPLTDPSAIMLHRVPFPEFGIDLIQESAAHAMEEISDRGEMILEDNDWEENWLFRKIPNKSNQFSQRGEPVTMLIPNPAGEVGPTIGDRDVDELSELSDRNSICSFDSYSEESDEFEQSGTKETKKASKELSQLVGEITSEFGQKDQEYTEDFSVLHRLQMKQKNQNISSVTERNSEQTKLLKKEVSKSKSQKSFKNLSIQSQLTLPKAPKQIPNNLTSLKSSSKTVWLENKLQNLSVPAGKALRLSCQVHAKQAFGVSWFFKDELLKDGKMVFIWRKLDLHNLNIFDMNSNKSGVYTVAAFTHSDCVWSSCHVTCLNNERATRIPRVTISLSDLTTEENSDVTLECQVGGHPEPKVTFIKGGKPIVPLANYYVIENDQYGTWSLRFLNVSTEDAGQIKAVVSNTLGHAMTSCQLNVVPEGQMKKSKVDKRKTNTPVQTPKIKDQNNTSVIKNSSFQSTNEKKQSVDIVTQEITDNKIQKEFLQENEETITSEIITVNGSLFLPPKPGTIAEREHRKWLEAKPLQNNPYSPEKLAHRLGGKTSAITRTGSYREISTVDAGVDKSLLKGVPVGADLSRYSRDYHVTREARNNNSKSINKVQESDGYSAVLSDNRPSLESALVRIENHQSISHWKEELKDIQLDVGKRVADIQKTIDSYEREWQTRLNQKGWNLPNKFAASSNFKNQRFSTSCFNLNTPKSKNPPSTSNHNNRHLIYSSTEVLNNRKVQSSQYPLWRTVSVDTLDSKPTSAHRTLSVRENNLRSYHKNAPAITSDSEDSSLNPVVYTNRVKPYSDTERWKRNDNNRTMKPYYSENSAESPIEETDTEESLSTVGEMLNLPSVKELASKFDANKKSKTNSNHYRTNHERVFRSIENKNIVIVEQNDAHHEAPAKKHDRRAYSNEVRETWSDRYYKDKRRIPQNRFVPESLSLIDHNRLLAPSKKLSFSTSDLSNAATYGGSIRYFPTHTNRHQEKNFIPSRQKMFSRMSSSNSNDSRFEDDSSLLILASMRNLSVSYSSLVGSDIFSESPNNPDNFIEQNGTRIVFGVRLRKTLDSPSIVSSTASSQHAKNVFSDLSKAHNGTTYQINDKKVAQQKTFQDLGSSSISNVEEVMKKPAVKVVPQTTKTRLEEQSSYPPKGVFSKTTSPSMYGFLKKYENKKRLDTKYDLSPVKETYSEPRIILPARNNFDKTHSVGSSPNYIPDHSPTASYERMRYNTNSYNDFLRRYENRKSNSSEKITRIDPIPLSQRSSNERNVSSVSSEKNIESTFENYEYVDEVFHNEFDETDIKEETNKIFISQTLDANRLTSSNESLNVEKEVIEEDVFIVQKKLVEKPPISPKPKVLTIDKSVKKDRDIFSESVSNESNSENIRSKTSNPAPANQPSMYQFLQKYSNIHSLDEKNTDDRRDLIQFNSNQFDYESNLRKQYHHNFVQQNYYEAKNEHVREETFAKSDSNIENEKANSVEEHEKSFFADKSSENVHIFDNDQWSTTDAYASKQSSGHHSEDLSIRGLVIEENNEDTRIELIKDITEKNGQDGNEKKRANKVKKILIKYNDTSEESDNSQNAEIITENVNQEILTVKSLQVKKVVESDFIQYENSGTSEFKNDSSMEDFNSSQLQREEIKTEEKRDNDDGSKLMGLKKYQTITNISLEDTDKDIDYKNKHHSKHLQEEKREIRLEDLKKTKPDSKRLAAMKNVYPSNVSKSSHLQLNIDKNPQATKTNSFYKEVVSFIDEHPEGYLKTRKTLKPPSELMSPPVEASNGGLLFTFSDDEFDSEAIRQREKILQKQYDELNEKDRKYSIEKPISPEILTKMIVRGSRFSKSGFGNVSHVDMSEASVPKNSPFAPPSKKTENLI